MPQTANEKAGKNSGCMMWPGSNFKYDDTACTFSQNFNETMSWNERVDIVMTWFTNEKTPANLVMMYIEEPDVHAHIYSPDSNVVSFHGSQSTSSSKKNTKIKTKKKIASARSEFVNLSLTL